MQGFLLYFLKEGFRVAMNTISKEELI